MRIRWAALAAILFAVAALADDSTEQKLRTATENLKKAQQALTKCRTPDEKAPCRDEKAAVAKAQAEVDSRIEDAVEASADLQKAVTIANLAKKGKEPEPEKPARPEQLTQAIEEFAKAQASRDACREAMRNNKVYTVTKKDGTTDTYTTCETFETAFEEKRIIAHDAMLETRDEIAELTGKISAEEDPEKAASLIAKRQSARARLARAASLPVLPDQITVEDPDLVIARAQGLAEVSKDCEAHWDRDRCRAARRDLALVEAEMFQNALADREEIAALKEKLTSGKLTPPQYAKAKADLNRVTEREGQVASYLVLPNPAGLYQTMKDFNRFEGRFYGGVEFVSLQETFGKAHPRIGTMIQWRYGGTTIPEHHPESGADLRYGLFHTFNAELTSSQETSSEKFNEAAEAKSFNVFQFDSSLYYPMWRTSVLSSPRGLRNYGGPIVSIGARKSLDDQDGDFVDHRVYGGFRQTISPEHFFEALVGRTGSLKSLRLEVGGQIPVRRFSDSTRLMLGARGNFGISDERKRTVEVPDPSDATKMLTVHPEKDAIVIYLSYNADFSKIFSGTFGN